MRHGTVIDWDHDRRMMIEFPFSNPFMVSDEVDGRAQGWVVLIDRADRVIDRQTDPLSKAEA